MASEKKDMLGLAKVRVRKILEENDPHPLSLEQEKEIDKILKKCIEVCVK